MPNPDGTRTRDEHYQNLLSLARKYFDDGMDFDAALDRASADYQETIRRDGDEKVAAVRKFLGIKSH